MLGFHGKYSADHQKEKLDVLGRISKKKLSTTFVQNCHRK